MNIILGLSLLAASYLIYLHYKNWRLFKNKFYDSYKLEIWDFKILIGYWFIIIMLIISSIIIFMRNL